jgi:hypothetical protein
VAYFVAVSFFFAYWINSQIDACLTRRMAWFDSRARRPL